MSSATNWVSPSYIKSSSPTLSYSTPDSETEIGSTVLLNLLRNNLFYRQYSINLGTINIYKDIYIIHQ